MEQIEVVPAALRQFTHSRETRAAGPFRLVVDESVADRFALAAGESHDDYAIIVATAGMSLAELLVREIPAAADVLVLATRSALASAPDDTVGAERTVAVVPGTADLDGLERIGRVIGLVARSDPERGSAAAGDLRARLDAAGALLFTDELTHAEARLETAALRMREDAGPFRAGVVQDAPSGRVIVTADAASLPLSGQLAVRGWPVVRARGAHFGGLAQQRLYERLLPVSRYPMVLTVDGGLVADIKAVDGATEAAAAALREFFDEQAVQHISALGFGVNSAVDTVRANSEANLVRASMSGPSAQLVLGPEADTGLQVILPLDTSLVTDAAGVRVTAPAFTPAPATVRRKLVRVKSPDCGC